jgi:MerR family transcriptional regulator, light-induced transcriptional regulator
MIDLKSFGFESLLNKCIAEEGIEQTITGVVFSFLERVGILWQTNRLRPVQEHIVSAIIRQKIINAIEGLPLLEKNSPLFVLFLPEGEHHEIGLLFVYYLLRKHQLPTIYLGANVPLKDIEYILQVKRPSFLYFHLTSFRNPAKFERMVHQLQRAAQDTKLVLSGYMAQQYQKQPGENLLLLQSLRAVQSYIETIR